MVQTSFSYKLSPSQQTALVRLLQQGNYRQYVLEHAVAAAEGDDCRIALYKSGKCLVQGKSAADFVTFVLEPRVLMEAKLGYEDILDPESVQPHIGVDESGKGDFFGPLVIAAAYVDGPLVAAMREMGVRDSKTISSDRKALEMARDLRKLLGKRYSIVAIGPAAYNRLYSKMRNLNSMLAWGHARAIENLLTIVPDCPRAISDQFGNARQLEQSLMHRGRHIKLVQRPRAESDLAVAAASVLARGEFLLAIGKIGRMFGVELRKGTSSMVCDAAKELVRKHGPGALLKTAKCHFSTTDKILAELNTDRKVLGEEGAIKSRPSKFRRSWSDKEKN